MKQNSGPETQETIKGTNVTHIEKTNFQDKPIGNFVQSTETHWIEQSNDRQSVFTFQESFRDEWSVYLFDASRNMYIALDLHQKKIKYKSSASAEYKDLYKVAAVSSAPPQYIFKSLILYNQWYASGGEQRSGLPHQSMLKLNNLVLNFRGNLVHMVTGLETMRRSWIRIENSKTGMTNALLAQFIPNMVAMASQASNLVSLSSQGSVSIETAHTIVKTHLAEDQAQLTKAKADRARAQEGMRVALINLAAAKAELQGEKGFLNGFLTGITFTAYNPVKENIDKQNNAINTYNVNLIVANSAIETSQRTQNELREEQKTLQQLSIMRKAFVYFQNDLSAAENALSVGTNSADKALATTNKRLGDYYKDRAGKQMHQVFGWINSFIAAN
ncbi:hypothetical protein IMCC3317_42400 [Kordia antarctica]|uniref:Uncharacterized protein n=1 Tax=Kordia antarctica TaxID=1218801 RepID=A0A7L4ZQR2_9FLAO|nr:hypothetical protein [Kordia antarctica]QHI38840.1 hypothetical protein IMCC3317_42400 [Kordia antarctica]